MADDFTLGGDDRDLSDLLDRLALRTRDLELGANGFARAMTQAFASSVAGGRRFDDVLKSLALRLSDVTLRLALRPLTRTIGGGIERLFGSLFAAAAGGGVGLAAATGAVKPFAAGGVIAAPTYFPLRSGGVGLAGEAGPEAILPLARTPDGRLGVAAAGGATNITIHIATPDLDGFRRSEAYLTGQIARAVARGQRGL